MNEDKIIFLCFDMGRSLITFFNKVMYSENAGNFEINVSKDNGYISNGVMSISYMDISDNELIYVYCDGEGMICLNTSSLDKTFVKLNGKNYLGDKLFEKEPFDFIQKVTSKLNFGLEDEHSKVRHI